jgi:phosphoribosylanthranilate isomerase
MRTRIKICGIASIEEAQMVAEAGVDALGFNCVNPPSPRTISEKAAAEIISELPPGVESFLLTSENTAERIADQVRRIRPTTVQILSHIDPVDSARLADLIPQVTRVQVVHVEDRVALDMIDIYGPHVHAFLLDSGRPNLAVPELGGTGRTHDWKISAEFVETSRLPVHLAGGISRANVAHAIDEVQPFGVDLSSGVRTEGRIDRDKLLSFVKAVHDADGRRTSV